MPRKYVKQIRPLVTRTRELVGTVLFNRFHQFYSFLVNFCNKVKVHFIGQRGTKIKFRLEVVY